MEIVHDFDAVVDEVDDVGSVLGIRRILGKGFEIFFGLGVDGYFVVVADEVELFLKGVDEVLDIGVFVVQVVRHSIYEDLIMYL